MNGQPFSPEKKFESPEEELSFLRKEVEKKEREIKERGESVSKDEVVSSTIKQYATTSPETVLTPERVVSKQEHEVIVLDLTPETHDAKIAEFIHLLSEKGVLATLSLVEALNDFHITDDFHRFLVQYIKGGFPAQLKENTALWRALHMTLYEVVLPASKNEAGERPLKELVSSMEQFYAGMLSVLDTSNKENNYFTIELAVSNHSDEFIFYVSVPDSKQNLFEKQVLSIFPDAKIKEKKDDYNIFNEGGVTVASRGVQKKNAIYPLKTYQTFDYDPLNVILNSFSKIKRDGEGASIQIVIHPEKSTYTSEYAKALAQIEKGTPVKEAIKIPRSFTDHFVKIVKDFAKTGSNKKDKEGEKPLADKTAIEQIAHKIETPIITSNIRIVASAQTEGEASAILSDLEASFNQFDNTLGNSITFKREKKKSLDSLIESFTLRSYDASQALPLSLSELTTLIHFPKSGKVATSQMKISKANTAPAPLDLPQEGTLLGVNRYRNVETKIFLTKEDRLRHFYAIGQTGTGKTTLLKSMIAQDILRGDGVCMIDPHGVDIQDILAIIPKERYEDVIYFDPSHTDRPMALNMLEYDARFPEQKTFVVNEMLSIFDKLFDMKTAGGPMFEQYFRNAVLLTIEHPESGNTLLDVSRVLSDKVFREKKLALCGNPIVTQFWKEIAGKAGGEASLANVVPYITSKFDNFLSNDIMRPIIAQEKSSFNFREIMDGKKILLVNLAKGRLGDINSHLIGLILVGKILMSALSRVDSYGKELSDFYLYIDEFQNITTTSIATILSEARKYRLSLNVAHQFIAQLDEKIKNAVFGNVGSIAAFRIGADDAEYLEKQFAPVFSANDLINLDNRNAYIKILAHGKPVTPFSLETLPPHKGTVNIEALKELSYLKFGRPKAEVEAEIMSKYKKEII